jgi:PAS domain S-box-containing protein
MFDFLTHLFDTAGFPPRGDGGAWTPGHGRLHVLSDLGVWSAYVAIPCVLGYLVLRRKELPFRTIFWLFGAFLLACGTTHLLEALLFWWPAYRLEGLLKLLTALVSWGTVVALVRAVPKVLAMRGVDELGQEVAARKEAEGALQRANSELQRQVEALRASEERFRLLVDGTQDYAIFMLDPTGRVTSWNPGAERIKQYRAEEILGQPFSRFYPAEDVLSGQPEHGLQMAEAEGRYEEEGWRLRKDGSRFWANVVLTALRDGGGKLRGFSKITRDRTERKQAEENARRLLEEEAARRAAEEQAAVLWEQRERLRVTLHSIGDGVIATDAAGRVTLLNPVAEALTGWSASEAAGQPLRNVFPIRNEKTGQEVENPVAKVLREGAVVGLANHTVLISKDGTERPIDDSAAPIQDDRGKVLGVVLVFRDGTEQRAREGRRAARLAVTQALAEANTLREAAPRVLRVLGENLGWKVAGFWLADAQRQEMRCLDFWHSPAVGGAGLRAAYRQFTFKPGVGLPGRVWASGQPAWVADVIEDANFPRAAVAAQEGLHAAFGFPVLSGGEVLGVIELFREEVRGPDADLMEMASSIGTLVGQFMERKSVEGRLRDERERFRTTLASIGDGVITTDTEGKVTFLNPVAESLTGWSQEGACGAPLATVFDIIQEGTRRPAESPVAQALREGRVVGLANHTVLLAKDGTERPIDDSAAPIRDSQGGVLGVVLVFRDVTERRRAEQELRQAERRFKAVFNQQFQFMAILALDGAVLEANDTCFRATNVERGRVLGRPLWETPWWDRLPAMQGRWKRILQEAALGGGPVAGEVDYSQADGSTRQADVVMTALKDDTGRVTNLIVEGRDTTQRRRQAAALREADRRKDEFLATLAHELRNPLAPLRTGLHVLRLADERAVWEEAREMMERQLGQMVRLVDDLLDISRISRNKLELRKARIGLAAVIENAVETARPLIESKGHTLSVALPPEPVFLDADLTRLAQVFWNLLNNSAKYTDPGGRIELAARSEGSEVVVAVRDTGIGIPAEALPGLFTMFSQVDHSLERSQGGLGIGLALVKGLVEMHGGTVAAHSAGVGRGSEFVVRLPLSKEEGQAEDQPAGEASAGPSRRRILIVDDNRDGAASLGMMLSLMGHDTRTAHDGLEAVELAEAFRPDMVLLDLGLPKLNGFDACRRIREQPWGQGIFIVAVTGWGQEDDRRRSQEAGFDRHLVKPVEVAALEKLLAGLGPCRGGLAGRSGEQAGGPQQGLSR